MAFAAAATEHLVPVALDEPVHPLQGPEVSTEAVVGVMPAQDLVEVGYLFANRQVPLPPHQVAQVGQAAAKSRLLRAQADLEPAFLVTRAVRAILLEPDLNAAHPKPYSVVLY